MLFPQLAKQTEVTSLDTFINDDSWVMEQKMDGHRLFLMSPGLNMPPTALTRSGSSYTRTLPKAIRDFRFPGSDHPQPWILDGELVGTVVNGHTVSSTFYVFDLPQTPDRSYGTKPLFQRRAALETFMANVPNPFKLVPQARTREEKITLAEKAIDNNLEGLIVKKVDAPYRSGGRTPEWLKIKFVATADVVVTDVRTDGKDSVGYAVYDSAGLLKPIGRASLIGKEKNGKINVGDVIEVRYLYLGSDGRLYQPTVLRKRDPNEKPARQCTTDQLKHVCKDVLETL